LLAEEVPAGHHRAGRTVTTGQVVGLKGVLKTLDAVARAVEAGQSKVALESLARAGKQLAAARAALARAVRPDFANRRCPIMGSNIVPEKVTANLVGHFKGGKVAFCCGMCPSRWDKPGDERKQANLEKAK